MDTSALASLVEHENKHWEEVFQAELQKSDIERRDFSSYWWQLYYEEIKKFVVAELAAYTNPRILEAGSGSGKASLLLGENYQRTLFDISESALRYARYLAKHFGAHNTTFLQGDIFHMPFPDTSYEFVWNIGVVEHYGEEEVVAMLAEMIRVTAKGGKVCVAVPNFKSLPIRKADVLRKKWLSFIPGYRLDTEREYSEAHLENLFAQAAQRANRTIAATRVAYFGNPLFMETPKWLLLTLGKLIEWRAPKSKFLILVLCEV